MGVDLKGVYLCARAAIPRMRKLGAGSIVNVASVNGFWVEPSLGAYCAVAMVVGASNWFVFMPMAVGNPLENMLTAKRDGTLPAGQTSQLGYCVSARAPISL